MAISRQGQDFIGLFTALVLLVAGAVGCAKVASPEGGPYDTRSPKVIRCVPDNGSTHVSSSRVRILFDEYIQLERGEDKIIYSPPQRIPPKAQVNQRQVIINYLDSLIPNTTYTVDFNRAIKDYNEGNYLDKYVYAFSTGEYLDSMQVSGQVLDAYTLQPVSNIIAGIYTTPLPADSINVPMTRMTYTDETGSFSLKNVRNGSYYAVALIDMDRSYSYSAPNESFAITPDSFQTEVFLRSALIPATDMTSETSTSTNILALTTDSLTKTTSDTLLHKGDSVMQSTIDSLSPYVYKPDNLVLLLSRPKSDIVRLDRMSRRDSVSLLATFTAPLDTLPRLNILSPDYLATPNSYYTDLASDRKSVVYWLSNHESLSRDSVIVSLAYPTTDSIGSPINKLDTITLRAPKVKAHTQASTTQTTLSTDSLQTSSDSTSLSSSKLILDKLQIISHEGIHKETTRDSLWITYTMPILSLDTTRIHLTKVVDSISQPVPYHLLRDSQRCCQYLVDFDKVPGTTYNLTIDTAAIAGLYSGVSAPSKRDLKIASANELGSLSITLSGYPKESPLYIFLLSSKEEKLAITQPDSAGMATFTELAPGSYFLKLFVDLNGNGLWDRAVYPSTPPEPIRYLSHAVSVQARFTTTEEWSYDATPLSRQRPKELDGTDKNASADNKSAPRKKDLNEEYIRRMRDRYGVRWNPTDRERSMIGMPSRKEESAAIARGELSKATPTNREETSEAPGNK